MFWSVLAISALFLVFITAHSQPASAGLVSFFEKLFSGNNEGWSSYNSQNVPLLKAPNTSEPKAAVGGVVINVVENSSLLPVVGPLGSIADVDTYKLDQITTYTVRDGDNLSKIADMFGISVSTIYWANDLKRGDFIKPGDVLVILPITGIQYQVKKGDTVQSIAKKYKSDAGEITSFNNLSENGSLEVGSTIIIPDAELAPLPTSAGKNIVRGGGGPTIVGYFIRPMTSGRKSQGLHGFNGIDLADKCGTPVYSSAGGTVLIARNQGWNGGYGKYVVTAHPNGTQTVYGHLSLVNVAVGQGIAQGYYIGNIGSTGNSTGCHLHFEVRGAKNPF